jgi:FdhD protein
LADEPISRPVAPHVVESSYVVLGEELLAAARVANSNGELFRCTGGSHMAVLLFDTAPSIVVEDISRTCALEKALGKALLAHTNVARSLLFLTSRVPMAFVQALARAGIPIIAAVSAPTYEAVQEAQRLGICLCGFVRNGRLNVYSHAWRVGL